MYIQVFIIKYMPGPKFVCCKKKIYIIYMNTEQFLVLLFIINCLLWMVLYYIVTITMENINWDLNTQTG